MCVCNCVVPTAHCVGRTSCAVLKMEYPAGCVSPPALVSALTRAGVGTDTLNSVAGKLLAAQYLQGGVSLDTLSTNVSLLRDRDRHGGAVKPTIILAVKKALGVRLPCLEGLRGLVFATGLRPAATPHGRCGLRPLVQRLANCSGTRVLVALRSCATEIPLCVAALCAVMCEAGGGGPAQTCH